MSQSVITGKATRKPPDENASVLSKATMPTKTPPLIRR